MNTQIIAIANQKGGVGKTTTCANLGIGLAQAGKKVLLIDGDPQGSLTISLGNPQPDKLPFTLSDAMGKILMDQPIRPGEGILHHAEGVDLMPADIQLSGMEVSLVNAMSRETILRQYLDTLKGQYSHMNTYKCQHNGDVAPHACHIFRFPVKNEKVYYKWNYYKSQWKKQTFPLTFQHKDNSFSLYDTNDSKSQCRDKKLQLVGCEKSPV